MCKHYGLLLLQDFKILKKLMCRGTKKKQSSGMQHSRIEGIMVL